MYFGQVYTVPALWQLWYPVSRDEWEMAGSQILTNVLTSELSYRHPA